MWCFGNRKKRFDAESQQTSNCRQYRTTSVDLLAAGAQLKYTDNESITSCTVHGGRVPVNIEPCLQAACTENEYAYVWDIAASEDHRTISVTDMQGNLQSASTFEQQIEPLIDRTALFYGVTSQQTQLMSSRQYDTTHTKRLEQYFDDQLTFRPS